MREYFDQLETRSPQLREAALMEALPRHVAHAQRNTVAFAEILAGVDAAAVTSRDALASLPVTHKSELLELQKARRAKDPFGGFSTLVRGPGMTRIYASPGPIYEPEGAGTDYWGAARALFAAGFRSGELLHNAFSYHMTPGAFVIESGALALGCTVFPAGIGQTEQQLQAMVDLRPDGYLGTPSFLRILIEKAQEGSIDISCIRRGLTSGEALPPSLRAWFAEQGVKVYQSLATADLGIVAYETEPCEGLVLNEGLIAEVVKPGTGERVPDGEVGELVVTTFNPAYPLIRFGTGDLTAVLPGQCPTGRTNMRIKGWMGRADQTTKIRGMFVHPAQVADVVRRFPEVLKARLVVSGEIASDVMTLRIEVASMPQDLDARIGEAMRDVTKLRCEVQAVAPGSLPNDGKVIEDIRSYK